MRVLAIADLHVDHAANRKWLHQLSRWDYQHDALLVAGDISDRVELLSETFEALVQRFRYVFFVAGNHDLWIRQSPFTDSLQKLHHIQEICQQYGVLTGAQFIGENRSGVWIIPLWSWYLKPEDGPGSLFLPKPGEDPTLSMWADNYHIRWPAPLGNRDVVQQLLAQNAAQMPTSPAYPVITFSHFLPRQELIFPDNFDPEHHRKYDRFPQFNFSRVAGCWQLDEQIRQAGATIHFYGHQHRNRNRTIQGVRYISHCLGYPDERHRLEVGPVHPLQLWDTEGNTSDPISS